MLHFGDLLHAQPGASEVTDLKFRRGQRSKSPGQFVCERRDYFVQSGLHLLERPGLGAGQSAAQRAKERQDDLFHIGDHLFTNRPLISFHAGENLP